MPGEQDVKIAVLEEQIRGMRDQQKAHSDNTEKLFTKLFADIDELKAALNRGRGAFTASLLLAGTIGGGITAFIEWIRR